ncbi:SusC/RagA family TonB-linked outer membrane protein [Leeuwenhoekiella sp. H156]|uniref:SusC/RagA family TonB-linked outer membrane protein n=1 Tax=Leeuwenhoekiella sp. H156 TaxID=3450128 RepID=UPI003FA46E03
MKSKITWCFASVFLLMMQFAFAQQNKISGTVTDQDGVVLPGVNVVVKGTNQGTQTDFDGNYAINVNVGQTLVFSFVGLKNSEKKIGEGQSVINVSMEPDADVLEEVVVQGYRTSTKEKSSIASVTVSAKSIENRPNASFVQTLSGQVAGLNISTASGQPGSNSTVILRGINSINGNIEPLFIIDGAPVDQDNFRSLNPQDIASISVLKDAGATAIYGNRGANGVIVIETRQGRFEQPLRVDVVSIYSFSTLQDNDYNLMNSQQQLGLEKQVGSGLGSTLTDAEIAGYSTTDWPDYFFRTANISNNTVNLSSGGSKSTQFTSLGYYDAEGILKNTGLQRFNIRNNLSGRSENDRFDYSSNFSINFSTTNEDGSIGTSGINRNPILAAYQSVPYISPDDYVDGASLTSPLLFRNTPLFIIDRLRTYTREDEEVKLIGSFSAGYKITNDIAARVVLSADYQNEVLTTSEASDSFNALLFGGAANPLAGSQFQQTRRVFSYNQVTSLNYNKSFGEHTFDLGLFTEYFKAHLRQFGAEANGLDPKTFSPGDGAGYVADNGQNDFFADNAFALRRNAGLFSYFARADYDYSARYGLTGTIRRDASYRFSGSNRWATFYSIAGRWNISNERFMQNSVFDVLKLRASYGTSGNQRISGDTYFSAPDLYLNLFATGAGYAGLNSIFLSQIGNTTLRWETVAQTNVGVDFEVFNRRLRGSFDVYNKETQDLFQSTPISAINGQTALNANVGSLGNKGFDFNINYDVIRGGVDGFNMNVAVLGNYNKTEILELPGGDTELIGTGRVGGPLFEYYTIRYAGVNPANGNVLFYTADGEVTETPNADTDRVWTGKNIYPDWNGGFNMNFDYKGFFLQTQWNYTFGVDRFDNDLAGFQNRDNIGQFRTSTDILRAWTPDNRVTDIPALGATNVNVYGSTRYLRSADYVRLRFASFGYSFPKRHIEPAGISSLRLFANAENLFTITEWRGFDAEAQINTSRIYPTPRTISFGIELGL